MGIAFVLLIWIVFFGLLALPVGAGLAHWSRRNARRKWRAVAAGVLPFILIPLGLAWFAGYGVYCEAVRGVDIGIGDGFRVPLPNGYSFCMIDTAEQAFVMKNGCSGVAAVDDIREIGLAGDTIVGSNGTAQGFTFDTRSNTLRTYPSVAAAIAVSSPARGLMEPDVFYQSRRWGWQDAVAFLLLVAAVLAISWLWFRSFIRAIPRVRYPDITSPDRSASP